MSGKIIEISCGAAYLENILSLAQHESVRILANNLSPQDSTKANVRLFAEEGDVQQVLDSLQKILPPESDSLVLLTPIDVQLENRDEPVESDSNNVIATREELFQEISRGSELDRNFIILAILGTLVATIGIAEDNTAVVIGAMVIAPLLGPNLGLALGAALGDKELIKTAIFTNATGVSLTILTSALITFIWPPNMESQELLSRTQVQPASVVLALVSGYAAVQSLTTRLSNTLVGVMIAVALAPPATVLGMMIGIQNWELFTGAALLLTVNIVAVNLSAQLVFLIRGIRPRTWLEQRKAKESSWVNIVFWIILLSACFLAVSRISQS